MTFRQRTIRRAVGTGAVLAALLAPAAQATAVTVTDRAAHQGQQESTETAAWERDGLSLNSEDNAAVDVFIADAAEAEALISPQLVEIAELTSAELIGFDHRLKTEDSLKRKVATWLEETPEKSVDEVLGEINDSVRYTLQWEDEEYTGGARAASDLLSMWRNAPIRWSNTWHNTGGYKAVNSAWREASTEHVFEVQFHTPASRAAALLTHPLYEEERLPSTSPERVAELREQQALIFGAVPVPEGAQELRAPRTAEPSARPMPLPALG
ncbi:MULTISPECIES: ATP nucleotide 3'-pyrophosphokinase [unclassified Streptomyces]|uniref:ATP nucleotide 3'-pyrophosphokinase n=1 Tax=unclassified Streptomyces TaxID=2593676 RepID=UPI000CD4FEA6|nr:MULTISPECIES: ATP nucleotide 3'-pyrophosphokinase [unclassified Streptomyces]